MGEPTLHQTEAPSLPVLAGTRAAVAGIGIEAVKPLSTTTCSPFSQVPKAPARGGRDNRRAGNGGSALPCCSGPCGLLETHRSADREGTDDEQVPEHTAMECSLPWQQSQ